MLEAMLPGVGYVPLPALGELDPTTESFTAPPCTSGGWAGARSGEHEAGVWLGWLWEARAGCLLQLAGCPGETPQ